MLLQVELIDHQLVQLVVTVAIAFVDKPFIPVIGGIQPDIFEQFATGVNKENGFIDRMLISYPELSVEMQIAS